MKLRAVPYEVPYRRPIQTAHGTLTRRQGFWVLVEADGQVGLGEVAPLPEWGTESLQDAALALAAIPEFSVPLELAELPHTLTSLGLSRDRLPATTAGVELACMDLLARHRGVSLASLLSPPGATPLETLPLNALLTASEPEALAEEALERMAEGFGTLKLKLGQGTIDRDVERLQAVRTAVGEAITLRGDANAAWDVETAAEALTRLEPFGLQYLEQPVADADALALLRHRTRLPLAADESAQDPEAVKRLISERAVDWLVLKPMALGGVLYARDLAQEALAAGIGVTFTSVLDRGVGTAAALHLSAALALRSAAGLSNTHMDDRAFVGPAPVKGRLVVKGPGHGVMFERVIEEVPNDL